MKKIQFTLLLSFFFALSLSAQFKIGAGLSLFDSNIGIHAKSTLGIDDRFDVGAMVNYFFVKGSNLSTIDTDVQYNLLGENGEFRIKGIGGLQFASASSETELGINVGALLEIPISETMEIYLEPKFVLISANDFFISAGVFF